MRLISQRTARRLSIMLGAILALSARSAGLAQNSTPDLTTVSLQDLMNIKVTSVSKKEEKLSKTAAAVYVITQEDIRRSGALNIPDLLRMVPGMDVAQVDANSWAISSRGFNDLYANKLLVMIDGRSVYDPAFGGVSWDLQNVPLEDIERIEVIRGPGATVWGANAVNGVINIMTKSAKATQRALVTSGAGSETTVRGLAQYGGKVRGNGYYRFFGQYFNDRSMVNSAGNRAADEWHSPNVGFRSDWDLTPRDSLTVEGDAYQSHEGQTVNSFLSLTPPFVATFNQLTRATGGSVLGRWNHKFSDRSDTSVQAYYDGISRDAFGLHEDRNTLDFQFQHHLALGARQDIVWGLGYRLDSFYIRPSYAVSMNPPSRTDQLFSSFIQDEIRLSDSFWVSLGSKFEHNNYTGFEYEPSVRMLWSRNDREALWGAVSRAIRQPTLEDVDVRVNSRVFPGPGGLLALASTFGDPHFKSEDLLAYELGYRIQPSLRFSVDLSSFCNDYHHLRIVGLADPFLESSPPPLHLVVPTIFSNAMHGDTYGAEISSTFSAFNWWSVSPGYSWLKMNLHAEPGSLASAGYQLAAGDSPQNQFQLRSYGNLPHHLEFDPAVYYVDRLPNQGVASHTRLDLRLGWRPRESVEFSVVGQNLLQPLHFEFGSHGLTQPAQIRRSVYGEITWRF